MHAADRSAELQSQVDAFPYWYHRIELPYGVTTPGHAPNLAEAYRIPEDLTGKRVLDVGAWDGYWTFEALKRGAKEVVAIDDFSDYIGFLEKDDRKAWANFDLCRDALGYTEEQCKRIDMSVYHANEATLGRFDVVFFFGTLYHLRYPLLALDLLSSVCNEEIYVETAICDDYSAYRGGFGQGYPGAQCVMEFYPQDQYGGNVTNWYTPSLGCLGSLLIAAGFLDVQVWKHCENPQSLPECRGYAKATKKGLLPTS